MKRLLRLALSLGLLLAILLVAAYLSFPKYSPWLVQRLLERSGVSRSETTDITIEGNGISVARATLEWERPGSALVACQFEGVRLGFSLQSLRTRSLTEARAESVVIRIVPDLKPAASEESAPPDPGAILAGIKLPLERIDISHLELHFGSPEQPQIKFNGRVTYQRGALRVEEGARLDILSPLELSFTAKSALLLRELDEGMSYRVEKFTASVARFAASDILSAQNVLFDSGSVVIVPGNISGSLSAAGSFKFPASSESPSDFSATSTYDLAIKDSVVPRVDLALKVPQYDFGLVASDISLALTLEKSKSKNQSFLATVRKMSLSMLGASISGDHFTARLDGFLSPLTVRIAGLDLQKLFEIYPQSKVAGTGTLDGSVIISVTKDKKVTAAGKLVSRPPGGTLRGNLRDWQEAHPENQGVRIAAQALEHFDYTSLQADIDYQPSGQLILKVALVGSNPGFQAGRTIHLNVSVEENLPALLKSLRYLR